MACHSPRDHWHVCVCLLAQNSHVSLFISPQSAPPIRGGRGGTGAKLLLDVLFYFSSFGSMDDCNARWWVWTWVVLAVRLVPFRAWHQNPPSLQCIHLSSLICPMSYWQSVLAWNSVTQSGYTGLGLGHRTVLLHCVPRVGALCSPLDNLINCILLYAARGRAASVTLLLSHCLLPVPGWLLWLRLNFHNPASHLYVITAACY